MDIDKHAEELASTLGADTQEVKETLEGLLQYNVPLDEAKQTVRRNYGGSASGGGSEPTTRDIAEIAPDAGSVNVTARVLTHGERRIYYNGEEQVIREGELADATGRISYTAWEEFGIEAGDSLTIGNANVREWDGKPELNLGSSTTVAMASEPVDTDYETGGDTALRDLAPGDRGRNVEVEVIDVERRTIDGRNGRTEILSGVFGDESGRLPFTDWNPHEELSEGTALRFENVYVDEFRGVPSVNLSEFTTATPLSRTVEVPDSAPQLSLAEAVGSGGAFDVEVLGSVLEVRDGSGLIERCPECRRVAQSGQCRTHGDVDGEDDMRVKAILDDGTGTVTVILDRELTEAVYGGTMDEALEQAREAMDKDVVADEIRDRIVGREYRVRGNLSVDDYGANFDATAFAEADDDPAARAASVLAEVRQ